MTSTKRAARDLQPGDVLNGSRETVIRVERGVRTPAGKVEVFLKRTDESTRIGIWNASTMIGITA
jgi:hypothetical protein